MNADKPRDGDQVRIVVEGTVSRHPIDPIGWHYVRCDDGPMTAVHASHVVSVEKVEPPKPPLPTTPGSVIRSIHGAFAIRTREGKWRHDDGGIIVTPDSPGARYLWTILFDAGAES